MNGTISGPYPTFNRTEKRDMHRFLVLGVVAIVALTCFTPAQEVGQAQGGAAAIPVVTSTVMPNLELGQELDARRFYPVNVVPGVGGIVVLGLYEDHVVLAKFTTNGLFYEGALVKVALAISPTGQQIVSTWTCRCHGVQHEVRTDTSSIYPEVAEEKHDKELERMLKRHPRVIQ